MKRNYYLLAGLTITGALACAALIGLFWTPYDPAAMDAPNFLPPCLTHPFGADQFGRDIFSRVMKGAGTTFLIALSVVALGAVGGVTLGAVTGYFGGLADEILMRVGDVLTAFPSVLLALVVISILGPGKPVNLVISLGLVFIPSFARVTRAAYAEAREANYVKSARLMGASHVRIMLVHILPNTTAALFSAVTIGFNNAALAEASMSYLGIGVTPPDASLGYMLSEAQGVFGRAPWYALSTGAVMILFLFGVGLIGEGLRFRKGDLQ